MALKMTNPSENYIRRFMDLVKRESDKDEDFVAKRVRDTPLYKLLEAQYDNVEQLLDVALKKSQWFERMRDAMDNEWKRNINVRVYNEPTDKLAERLVYYMSFQTVYKEVYDKCMFRYGRPKLEELAKEIVLKYPHDMTAYGKYPNATLNWK